MPPSRPTILQIIPELDTGGAERTTIEIAEAIVAAGGRALVLSEGGRMAGSVAAAGGEFIPFRAAAKNPLRLALNARAIARIVRDENVHLVHARSRAPAWSALAAARRMKRPFVTTYHGAYGEKTRIKRFYNSVMARGDLVIANSNYTADLVRTRYDTPVERMRVIHRGVDASVFDPARIAPERIAALRGSWGVPDGARIVLNAARLTGWKGQRVLIEAMARLAQIAPDAAAGTVAILAGDDQGRSEYRQSLIGQIAAAGLGEHVRLVGHVADIPAAFAAAWIGVVASTEPEAFGRAATESQVMGCPVIATAIGAPPETVLTEAVSGASGMSGWLVPPGDAGALAEALRQGLELDPSRRREIGSTARRNVSQRFSLAGMCEATLAVYDELLGTSLATAYRAAATRSR
ncbi:MAG: glycosyltransferase family 4 protein [Hyphomicrobiaceae bacterium]